MAEENILITVDAVKALKKDAESEIRRIIEAFSARTGVYITGIDFTDNYEVSGTHRHVRVELKTSLN